MQLPNCQNILKPRLGTVIMQWEQNWSTDITDIKVVGIDRSSSQKHHWVTKNSLHSSGFAILLLTDYGVYLPKGQLILVQCDNCLLTTVLYMLHSSGKQVLAILLLTDYRGILAQGPAHFSACVSAQDMRAGVGQRLRVFGCKCGPRQDAWFGGDTHSLSRISARNLDLTFVVYS